MNRQKTDPTNPSGCDITERSATLVTFVQLAQCSPHTQTVGPLHSLAVPQHKAPIMSKPLQQPFCGLGSNPPVVNRLDQHALPLHVASEAAPICTKCVRMLQF